MSAGWISVSPPSCWSKVVRWSPETAVTSGASPVWFWRTGQPDTRPDDVEVVEEEDFVAEAFAANRTGNATQLRVATADFENAQATHRRRGSTLRAVQAVLDLLLPVFPRADPVSVLPDLEASGLKVAAKTIGEVFRVSATIAQKNACFRARGRWSTRRLVRLPEMTTV
jgi:hypothetical protein